MRHLLVLPAAVTSCVTLQMTPLSANVLIEVNKSAQEMTVEIDGLPVQRWPVSTGRLGHDTPNGTFPVISMDADHYSKEWDNAPMPNSIFFTKNGHAIHAPSSVGRLGTPASHGCIRLAPKNAARLYAIVREHGISNTNIVVLGDVRIPTGATSLVVSQHPRTSPTIAGTTHIAFNAQYQYFGDYQPDALYNRFH